jgi:hypothetical protein
MNVRRVQSGKGRREINVNNRKLQLRYEVSPNVTHQVASAVTEGKSVRSTIAPSAVPQHT